MGSTKFQFSIYYFFSSSLYSFLLAFFPLHCTALGFSPFQIASLSAAATAATILTAPLVLQLAHSYIAARKLLILCSLLALVLYLPLFVFADYWTVLLVFFVAGASKRGADSLVDAQAIRATANRLIRFERVRLFGSIGFIVATFAIGYLCDVFGNGVIIPSGFVIVAASAVAAIYLRRQLADTTRKKSKDTNVDSGSQKNHRYLVALIALLVTAACTSLSHSALYVYFSIYLEALGWTKTSISLAWNIGVLAEIAFFISLKRIESRFSLKSILQLSIFAACLRWAILYTSKDTSIILLSQLLHGLSFGGTYVSSMKLVHWILPESLKDRGQGLLTSFGAGLGSLSGRFIVGATASSLISYTELNQLFLHALLFSALGLLASFWIHKAADE